MARLATGDCRKEMHFAVLLHLLQHAQLAGLSVDHHRETRNQVLLILVAEEFPVGLRRTDTTNDENGRVERGRSPFS